MHSRVHQFACHSLHLRAPSLRIIAKCAAELHSGRNRFASQTAIVNPRSILHGARRTSWKVVCRAKSIPFAISLSPPRCRGSERVSPRNRQEPLFGNRTDESRDIKFPGNIYARDTRCINTDRLFTTQSRLGPRTVGHRGFAGLTRLTLCSSLSSLCLSIYLCLYLSVYLPRQIEIRTARS